MTVFAHIHKPVLDTIPDYMPGTVTFRRLSALPAWQHAMWNRARTMPFEAWAAPLDAEGIDMTVNVAIAQDNNAMFVVTAPVKKADGDTVRQPVYAGEGFLTRKFYLAGNTAGHLSGAQNNPTRPDFVPRMMRAFHAMDLRDGVPHVNLSAVNVGSYVWHAYGGVPSDMKGFANESKARWQTMLRVIAQNGNAAYDKGLEAWVDALAPDMPSALFRKPFAPDAPALTRRTMKALVLGNIHFLDDEKYVYTPHGSPSKEDAKIYGTSMDRWIRLYTQEADFQRHFHTYVDRLIVRPALPAPKPPRFIRRLIARLKP